MSASQDSLPTGLDIQATGLTMTFRRGEVAVEVLRDIDLAIPGGQFVCAFGPSGSGKSTLLQLIAGLLQPTGGRVLLGGTDVGALSQDQAARFRRRNVGIVFQFFNLSPMLTVEENVALPLLLDGAHMRDLDDRIAAMLERLRLPGGGRRLVEELSGGELQRVAMARALLAEPRLLLADEPTGNLDSRTGAEVLGLLRGLADERGITTVLLTHDLRANTYADRVLSLRNGRIEEDLPAVEAT